MKAPPASHPAPRGSLALLSLLTVLAASRLPAQTAPLTSATPAATLTRFDTNRNGHLDADEIRAMETELRRAPATNATPTDDSVVTMSPFEVVSDTRGYYATNTMSGTRLNTKLEDLASSISVITKEQMADFAMLDINDVFLYAGNAEGTGTYTEFSLDDGQGTLTDSTSGDPANANRIRGIGNANVSISNFESSNRVPIDPIDADGVEVSRGPNANIFGLGNASGTVNVIGAAAHLTRNRASVGFRADSFDGHRQSIDLNHVLIRGVLGIRGNAVFQRDGFDLKPSGVDSQRYNAMLKFQPFKKTTVNATYQVYRLHGNRPNSTPPMDGVTDWLDAGAPTWDPPTNTRRLNGVVVSSSAPAYLYAASSNFGQLFVERDGSLPLWMSTYGTNPGTNPLDNPIQENRAMYLTRALTVASQPLISRRVEMISDKSIYDWSRINFAAPNWIAEKAETARITLDQIFFDAPQQSLAAQFGFFREDSERYRRYLMNDGPTSGPNGQLVVDVNERLLDGSVSPFFLRPLIQVATPVPKRQPLSNRTYRGQFAYKYDFTRNSGLSRWLGAHGLVGYSEYKERVTRSYSFYEQIVSRNPWMLAADGSLRLHSRARPNVRFYLGDDEGYDIDYAPGVYSFGPTTFVWGNAVTPGGMKSEPVEIGEVPANSSSGSRSVQKTEGAVLQSRLLQDRIVATLGTREDRHYTKFQNATRLKGLDYDYDWMNSWREGDWQFRDGGTETRGVVVRPLRFDFVDRAAREGSPLTRFVADGARKMTVHYNESDSFKPAGPAMNVYGQWLPDPSGTGKDYGFSLNLLDGKLVVRVNKYQTEQLNSRSGPSAAFARQIWGLDFSSTQYGLQQMATTWITEMAQAQGRTLTPDQLNAELTRTMGTAPREVPDAGTVATSETDDIVSKGHEVEIHYNPTRYWTMQVNFTEKQTINTRLARNVSQYIQERMPVWTTVVDPRTGQLWWNTLYGGSETPAVLFRRVVANPLQTATATEGLSRPQIRRYSGNLSTNFRLSGITDQKILKRFNVGGALRYESKGAIGYWGVQQLPAIITDYDINRPIWDKAHIYVDALMGYRTKLWSDRIGATFQLNVRNIQEDGRLQPIAAGPEGKLTAFRIIAPRQFILSATFDL